MILRTELLDIVLEQIAIVVADMDTGEIVFASRPAEEMFGWMVYGELTGQAVEVLVPAGLRDKHMQHRANYARDPQHRPMGGTYTLQGQRRNGGVFPVEIALSPVMLQRRRCVIATVIDLSGRQKAGGHP